MAKKKVKPYSSLLSSASDAVLGKIKDIYGDVKGALAIDPSLSEEEQAQIREQRKDALTGAVDSISEMFSDQATADPLEKQKETAKVLTKINAANRPTNLALRRPEPYFPSLTKPLPSAGGIEEFISNKQTLPTVDSNPSFSMRKRFSSLYDTSAKARGLNVSGSVDSGPIMVYEGMSERSVSDFGTLRGGAKNRAGLLKKRSEARTAALASGGTRG